MLGIGQRLEFFPLSLRILIVEDEDLIALDVQEILEQAGHHVVGRATGMAEAIKLAAETKPQIAILDVDLKEGGNGMDTAEELTSQHSVRVLFLTGRSDFLVRAMAMNGDPLGYIQKPYKPSDILDALAA